MGKISPYNLGSVSVELEQFRDDVTNSINLGKVTIPVVTAVPNWNAQPMEMVAFWPASGGTTVYFYKNSAWVSSWSVTV